VFVHTRATVAQETIDDELKGIAVYVIEISVYVIARRTNLCRSIYVRI